MSIRTVATLAVAILLGLIAVLLVRSVLNSQRVAAVSQPASSVGTLPVVVAAEPIARGQAIEPEKLKVVRYPAGGGPEGTFASIAEVTGHGQPRLALSAFVANEPLLSARVSGPGGKLNLSAVVAPGMRAVSLRSNDVAGVGGFVLPGDRVDVLLTRSIGSGDDTNTVTQVVAENVRVLGVDQSADDASDKPVVAKAVTIEVTPNQAQEISLGQSVGSVSLALRHVADSAQILRQATQVGDLGFGPRKLGTGGSGGPKVRVIRGVDTTTFTYSAAHGLEQLAKPAGAAASSVGGVTP
ncbi:MAG TPA: Flp pilus assembly protein CpaB [Rhizomicrobium sp.]|jgi:pilus assembly protein CpaB